MSPDEQQLAIEIEGATHDLYTYGFARGVLTKLTFDGASHWPLWMPQRGRLIVSKPQLLWSGRYSHGMSTSCGAPGPTSANYDVTADGSRFIMIEDKAQDVVARQIHVVLNWAQQLKRLEQESK